MSEPQWQTCPKCGERWWDSHVCRNTLNSLTVALAPTCRFCGQAARAQTAQAVPLTDDPLFVFAQEVIHGAYKPDELKDAAMRAIRHHSAVRAKMGAAVPMTDPQLQTSEERRATGERIMAQATQELSDLVRRARDIVVGHQKGSISLVQRRLRISYNTAAKLLEALEQEGVVSPQRQNGQREVLVLPDISGIVGKEGA